MPQNLNINGIEQGTLLITAEFEDEFESSVIPNNITWTLTDAMGNVLNARSAIDVAVPAASIIIVLFGNDLVTLKGINEDIFLTIVWDYDSSNGSGLPHVDQVRITIEDLVLIKLPVSTISDNAGVSESVTVSIV